jgi:hypothetical protein
MVFTPKQGLEKVLVTSFKQFSLTPYFVYRVDANQPVFKRHYTVEKSRGSDSMAKLVAATA